MRRGLAYNRKESSLYRTNILDDPAFARVAGAPLVKGNKVGLLKDAGENYPAWISAIESAKRYINFECYIVHDDDIGQKFADLLESKAREGVKVRVLYDWLGSAWNTSRRFWRRLEDAGCEVRCFNPPQLDSPLGWTSRDHRKMLSVDGEVAFVFGLCVGRQWAGDPKRKIEPWRDTGVEIRGPALGDIERAFADIWAVTGPPIPAESIPKREDIQEAGHTGVRVIPGVPNTAGIYRLDQLVAASAKHTLWLTDAYFVGTTPYVQALRAAARDKVDVRLLIPGASDIKVLTWVSRAGYRSLLEAGVKIYEWNGTMLHAKTAVADGRWSRVGSTNLNVASWMGNWELDVTIEDESFAKEMEEMYLEDLENATEILLSPRNRVTLSEPRAEHLKRRKHSKRGTGAGALRIGNTIGAALTDHRLLGPAEARLTALSGVLLLIFSLVVIKWPSALAWPVCVLGVWISVSLIIKSIRLHKNPKTKIDPDDF